MTILDQPERSTQRAHRGDIDGLRAVAILLVVAFHVRVPGFGGGFVGVDVFFVISGYLITRNLLRETEEHGRVRLLSFTAKRLRRLVPALALVIVATLVLSVLLFAPVRLSGVARDGAAAAAYVSNMVFAVQAEDYFAGAVDESPFLHTWSLGVEEQFYLLWPALFVAAWAAARRFPGRIRLVLASLFSATFVVSMAINLLLVARGSVWAFYGLPSRAWEFAVAGLLALATLPAWIDRRGVRTGLALAGVALLAVALVQLSDAVAYPGLWALLPVSAAVLLIVAGSPAPTLAEPAGTTAARANLVSAVLATPLAQWVGRMSYSWYLWHWPLIIFVPLMLGTDRLLYRGLGAALGLPLAVLAYHFVENPIRLNRVLVRSVARTFAMAAAVTGVVFAAVLAVQVYEHQVFAGNTFQRQLHDAQLAARVYDCGEQRTTPNGIEYCRSGDVGADKLVLLLGDSHARHWKEALSDTLAGEGIALADRWSGACPVFDVGLRRDPRHANECERHRDDARALIAELQPDVVVVSHSSAYASRILDEQGEQVEALRAAELWEAALESFLDEIEQLGSTPAMVLTNPVLDENPIACMSAAGAVQPCEPTRKDALRRIRQLRAVELAVLERRRSIPVFDLVAEICDDDSCALMLGGNLVYADPSHLTPEFTASKQSELEELVNRALGNVGR